MRARCSGGSVVVAASGTSFSFMASSNLHKGFNKPRSGAVARSMVAESFTSFALRGGNKKNV